jgi:hypothetical protein
MGGSSPLVSAPASRIGIESFLPRFDVRQRQELRVRAPSETALAAARAVTAEEAPLLRLLFRLRGLPASGAVLAGMEREGFQVLADDPGRALVVGAVGRPWRPSGAIARAADFAAFDEPGWAKMALELRAEDGVLSTETRVLLTDEAARRAFRRYWLVVRPFSVLTRRSWLAAAKRRAERTLWL